MIDSRYPVLHRASFLIASGDHWPRVEADGKWLPARPLGVPTLGERIRLAWGVLSGRYDALDWGAR